MTAPEVCSGKQGEVSTQELRNTKPANDWGWRQISHRETRTTTTTQGHGMVVLVLD